MGQDREIIQNKSLITLRNFFDDRETRNLSSEATFSRHGQRRKQEQKIQNDYRQNFALDADRIMHSLAYTRYIDKPQVFYLTRNDHITHRVLHVQLVSKIGRTIGRFLELNEDLIEAIALGHDIGHTPFGHDGETFLSEICQTIGIGNFYHSVQSVRFLDRIERKGKGWNLCLQTLDGILCHDGEIHNQKLIPQKNKTFEILEQEMKEKTDNPKISLIPMTSEGCVARMADTISYIGRDIEDAIRMELIKREDIPHNCVRHLGNTNGTIVYNLVTDLIQQSLNQSYIAYSPEVSQALANLKKFNLERIYQNPKIKKHLKTIRSLFSNLFEKYLNDIQQQNKKSVIFSGFLEGMSDDYYHNYHHGEIVRDFIAGMTDKYLLEQCPANLRISLEC